MSELSTIIDYAVAVLTCADLQRKADLTLECANKWNNNELKIGELDCKKRKIAPSNPSRDQDAQKEIAQQCVSKMTASTATKKQLQLLHSLAHIESYAVDLSWDILLRFANDKLPNEFYTDWLKIAEDEARHFNIWKNRLIELGCYYGFLPIHHGLWQSASTTANSLLERLSIVHMVHEARGLDVSTSTSSKLTNWKDSKSVELLDIIVKDEITHVTAGMKWFRYLCENNFDVHVCESTGITSIYDNPMDNTNYYKVDNNNKQTEQTNENTSEATTTTKKMIELFHVIVRNKFNGVLKPPFNTALRTQAGFTEDWYLPLTKKE